MFNQIFWQDRVTQYKDRYRESQNPDGTYTHTRVEGEIIQKGTPHNQNNMNSLGFGIQDTHIATAVTLFQLLQYQRLEEADPDVFDCLVAGRLVTFAGCQRRMATEDALDAMRAEFGGRVDSMEDTVAENAEAAELSETDNRIAGALTAFGGKQRQMMNESEFALIASEALGESHEVTLTNNQRFPFNSTVDNPTTIALTKRRANLFYSVEPEVTAHTGPVGDISITGKALNGFKVSFNGSGTSVTMILRVKGGMSHG